MTVTKNILKYTITGDGGLYIEVDIPERDPRFTSFKIPKEAIVSSDVKNHKYAEWVSQYAHSYFSTRNIGMYSIIRVDVDGN